MKKWPKNLGIIILTVLYCFTTLSATAADQSNFRFKKSSSEQNLNSTSTQEYVIFFNQKESRIHAQLDRNSDIQSDELDCINYEHKCLFNTKFAQYGRILKNRLINNRKSNIIFPFHYFW